MGLDKLTVINLESDVFAYLLVAAAVTLILTINRKPLLLRYRQGRIQTILDRIGAEQIRHMACPDGLDGYYDIDRLVLCKDAILLIVHKTYGGNIYCAEHISEWTQVVGQKSFKFENPLFELENQLTSLRQLIDLASLSGFLFFDHSAVFPKGHPQRVLHPGNIPEQLLGIDYNAVNPEIRATWELLKTMNSGDLNDDQLGVDA